MNDLKGSLTALVTPFKNGAVDADAFQRIVDRQIKAGTAGLIPAGSTGESATLAYEEHFRVIELAVEAASGRVPVIAGAGSNVTARAIELVRFAEKAGADGVLALCGYYNKPTQAGLIAHFTALHEATRLPIILYNVPARTVVSLSVETIATLSKLPRIIGIKDATGDLARVALQREASGPGFIQLSGEDMTAVGFNAMGGRGCISVTANVAPALCAKMQNACLAGDYATALSVQDRLAPLHEVLFVETNPAPVKYAMSLMGLMSEDVRLPLVPPTDATKGRIKAVLEAMELID
ncbi:MAG: 4-hydroxy-tetrahydrodipicolinate synthase [Parvularculaceae bacterium]|nr:4-hydroxy-tetrahydrodipicolinate synthase [Parvularculaceae bacterium]